MKGRVTEVHKDMQSNKTLAA